MNKMNKLTIAVLVVILLIGGLVYYYTIQQSSELENVELGEEVAERIELPLLEGEVVVSFTDSGYSPETVTVKTGQTVVFANESDKNMWPASAAHPTHEVYPTTGGCIGSTFDACGNMAPKESWSFQFDEKGVWKYHDHLNADYKGTVVVE